MMAKFLGGTLSQRPMAPVQGRLQRIVGKAIQDNPRGAPGNRMVAGMAREFSGRNVPIDHPWYQKVISNRGAMNKPASVWSKPAGALMGMGRMIPVGKALGSMAKKAPLIAGRGAAAGPSLASQARAGMKATAAAPRPITLQKPMTPGGKPAPIMPEQPAGMMNPRPTVRPPNFNSTFDTSVLYGLPPRGLQPGLQGLPMGFKGTFGKVAALRSLSPLARLIGNMPAKNFRF